MPSKEERIRNLRRTNEQSHQLIVDSLRQALYELLETRDVGEIKVVDLIRRAIASSLAASIRSHIAGDRVIRQKAGRRRKVGR